MVMRKITTILMAIAVSHLFIMSGVTSQPIDQHNFSGDHTYVKYEKVFEGEIDLAMVTSIKDLDKIDKDTYKARLEDRPFPYGKYGISEIRLPLVYAGTMDADVIIDIKIDRYRITIDNIIFKGEIPSVPSSNFIQPLEAIIFNRNGKLHNRFANYLTYFNQWFADIFNAKEEALKEEDEW